MIAARAYAGGEVDDVEPAAISDVVAQPDRMLWVDFFVGPNWLVSVREADPAGQV